MTTGGDLEDRFLWVVRAGVFASGAALAAGLLLHVARAGGPAASRLLALGLVLLMATPVSRLLLASLERVRRRDWQFVLVTLVVLLEVALTMWLALARV